MSKLLMRSSSEIYNLGVSTSQGTYYGLLPSRDRGNRVFD